MDKLKNYFLLLQINDALFPIGGYSHSYGLETYIQKNLVSNVEQAAEYIKNRIRCSFLYTDLLGIKLAWHYAVNGDMDKILELEQKLEALKQPEEIRMASHKLSSRFIKTVLKLNVDYSSDIFLRYTDTRIKSFTHYITAYGVFCAACEMEYEDVICHFLFAQTSAMVTCCVKTIPLSQTDGQKLLEGSFDCFKEILVELKSTDEDMLGCSAPGFDIRCMQHERLYSRLYMS